jgi:hypothetical protein
MPVQQWDVPSALAFLRCCRVHKPLLAAQRQHSTLVSILSFLQNRAAEATTLQLSSLLLDLAFIGCQSFKAHGVLPAISRELVQRITDGSLDGSAAVQLADSVRAFDKLEHAHAALHAAAGAPLCPSSFLLYSSIAYS